MTDEPQWVGRESVDDLHQRQLLRFGGAPGLRDEGLLESALAKPRHQFAYGESDLCRLAASYVFGLAKNHPFVDGNKRAAFVTGLLFLNKNGLRFVASQADATATMLAVASGTMSEDALASWLRTVTQS